MWEIKYHPLVIERDFRKISRSDQERIVRVIHKKLKIDPIAFGKPLIKELKGYYRLRFDPYRVVYTVKSDIVTVFVLAVDLRKDFIVYSEAIKRLP